MIILPRNFQALKSPPFTRIPAIFIKLYLWLLEFGKEVFISLNSTLYTLNINNAIIAVRMAIICSKLTK